MFEWYVDRCGSKNWHQQDVCFKEIGLRAQYMVIILGSIFNMFEGGGSYGTIQ